MDWTGDMGLWTVDPRQMDSPVTMELPQLSGNLQITQLRISS